LNVICRSDMRNARFYGMRTGSAKFFGCYRFVGHGFHYIRTGDKHITGVFNHQRKIGHCRRINGTTGTRSHNCRKLRYNTRRLNISEKYIGITAQRSNAFLNSRSSRVVQTNNWRTNFYGLIHNFTNFFGMRFRERSAKNRKILCKYINQSSVNCTISSNNTITKIEFFFHAKIS